MEQIVPPKGEGWQMAYSKVLGGEASRGYIDVSGYGTVAWPKDMGKNAASNVMQYANMGSPTTLKFPHSEQTSSALLRPVSGGVIKMRYSPNPVPDKERGYFFQWRGLLVSEETFQEYCNSKFSNLPQAFPDDFAFLKEQGKEPVGIGELEPVEIKHSQRNLEEEIQTVQRLKESFAGKEHELERLLSYALDQNIPVRFEGLPYDDAERVKFIEDISLLFPDYQHPTFATSAYEARPIAGKTQLYAMGKNTRQRGPGLPFNTETLEFNPVITRSGYVNEPEEIQRTKRFAGIPYGTKKVIRNKRVLKTDRQPIPEPTPEGMGEELVRLLYDKPEEEFLQIWLRRNNPN